MQVKRYTGLLLAGFYITNTNQHSLTVTSKVEQIKLMANNFPSN